MGLEPTPRILRPHFRAQLQDRRGIERGKPLPEKRAWPLSVGWFGYTVCLFGRLFG